MLNVSFHECLDVIHKKPATMSLWWHVIVSTHNHGKGRRRRTSGSHRSSSASASTKLAAPLVPSSSSRMRPSERRTDGSAGSRTPTLWQVSRSRGTSPGHSATRPLGLPRSPLTLVCLWIPILLYWDGVEDVEDHDRLRPWRRRLLVSMALSWPSTIRLTVTVVLLDGVVLFTLPIKKVQASLISIPLPKSARGRRHTHRDI